MHPVSVEKAIRRLRRADPVLRRLIDELGPYGIQYSPPDFATMARCIVYQQLSGKVALTIYRRLEQAASNGSPMSPRSVLELEAGALRAAGLSGRKIEYLRELAGKCCDGTLDLAALENASDEEVMRALTALRGVGAWTVHMYLIFALRRLDVLPAGDLGIRAAIRRAYGLDTLPSPSDVERMGQRWRPYATVAAWYLWRSLGDGAGL
ncbi:MAG: DNA-3-methyladenine glycosylase 2 family protein [Bryobacteraceae bacterium]|nr:DNA-3-methyladenine glycosylase 2 family protein [Bryobacteraceae bacterium]